MSLTNEIMKVVLPEFDAPWEPTTVSERNKFDRLGASSDDDYIIKRSYSWQKWMMTAMRQLHRQIIDHVESRTGTTKGVEFAVGFIELDKTFRGNQKIVQDSGGTGYFFGGLIMHRMSSMGRRLPSSSDTDSGPVGRSWALFSEDFDLFREDIDFFSLVDTIFPFPPIVYLEIADEFDAPPRLHNATVACWARRNNRRQVDSVLTAKHAISGLQLGQNVSFQNNQFGKLVQFCPSSVDAAIVQSPLMPVVTELSAVAIDDEPANGEDVEFVGDQSGTCSGKITKTWVFPDDLSEYDPQRVYLDFRGIQGDSGSLVRNTKTGEAVSLYVGKKRGRSAVFGQSQYLTQAVHHLNVALYE